MPLLLKRIVDYAEFHFIGDRDTIYWRSRYFGRFALVKTTIQYR